jgi:transposase-like protein
MMNARTEPKTLQQAIVYFADPDNCLNYLVARRWPNGVTCPRCGSDRVTFMASRRVWQCKTRHPKSQFSVKVGTIFEDSPIGLDKWLCAMWMLANCKNGASSWEIHRTLGVTQKTAWFMLQRIRLALQGEETEKMSGTVEADETFIGGLAKNMHKSTKEARGVGQGGAGKSIVMGILERHADGSRVKAKVILERSQQTLHEEIKRNVEPGAEVMTDAHRSYMGLNPEFVHQFVDHTERYVDGNVHTNAIENFWSCLKRSIKGTYVSVEPFHLFRYVDEQTFRFNERKGNDAHRFSLAVSRIVGKRLTYAEVTGKVGFISGH